MKRSTLVRLFITCALLGTTLVAVAALADTYSLIRIDLTRPGAEDQLKATPHLDITVYKPGSYAEVVVQSADLERIDRSGLGYSIDIDDLEAHYAQRSRGVGFGIFHTYSESAAFVDSLHLLYPDVVSEKWSIGQSLNGNDIWCFRVSDNPDVDEDEPEVCIDGMHHAREIMASEFPIMFAEYLAQNYGSDPEITWLVDNRELYVIPIVNPDGVIYNEQTNPSGGGMWRKTRRNNGDGTYGVDPNRNYPYRWGYDNYGSSPYTSDEDYRGPSAGSELCVQAMMDFFNGRNIITHDSVHTYSNLLLYPWGYSSASTADGALFETMAAEMTRYNGYDAGQPGELLYDVNGGAFDWAYGATGEHAKVLSFSTEIGGSSDGFWPDEARRGPLFQENLWPHIYLMRAAGAYVTVADAVTAGPSKAIEPGQTGTLDFTITNQSAVASALGLSLTAQTDDPWIQLLAAERNVGDLAAMSSTTLAGDPIPFTVDSACPDGHLVNLTVTAHLAEGDLTTPLSFIVGSPNVVFFDDFETGLGAWQTSGQWGLYQGDGYSPTSSLTDTPAGDYSNQTETYAQLGTAYPATELSFWHRYEIEDGWDFGYVQVSTDGQTWVTLGTYTDTQTTWQQATFDLSAYNGQPVYIRFFLDTDYSVIEDGWYIDDVTLVGAGSDNLPPAVPVAVSPGTGAVTGVQPELVVANSSDPEGAGLVYGFRVYSDALCTDLAASVDDVTEQTTQTSWQATSLADGAYWWRAYAGDGVERSDLSQPVAFTVDGSSAVDGFVVSGPALRVLGSVSGQGARLELSLPNAGDVNVDIYDARGARIRHLLSGHTDGGTELLVWDGRDDSGRNTASGVYFVRLQAGRDVATGRVVVVR